MGRIFGDSRKFAGKTFWTNRTNAQSSDTQSSVSFSLSSVACRSLGGFSNSSVTDQDYVPSHEVRTVAIVTGQHQLSNDPITKTNGGESPSTLAQNLTLDELGHGANCFYSFSLARCFGSQWLVCRTQNVLQVVMHQMIREEMLGGLLTASSVCSK